LKILNKNLFFLFTIVLLVGDLANFPCHVLCALGGDPVPSPPPCAWSQGFLATPLTVGLNPNFLVMPAFFQSVIK